MLTIESLRRYLRILSIEEETPLMSTDKLLKQMVKQGYIKREQDHVVEEQRFDYYLGPRGKVEVGKDGAKKLVRKVFTDSLPVLMEGV